MSVRRLFPKTRLRDLMDAPGGVSVAVALSRATVALETIRQHCLDGIDDKIENIARLGASPEVNAQAIYHVADEIFSEAGTFGMNEVSAAAYSLCTLLSTNEGMRAAEAIAVHVDALRVLRHPDVCDDAARCAEVLAGLNAVAERFGDTECDALPRGAIKP